MSAAPASPPAARAESTPLKKLVVPYPCTFRAEATVGDAIEAIRGMVQGQLIVYAYVLDAAGRLEGVVAMRELLLAVREQRLGTLMLRSPFALREGADVLEAMKLVLQRHFPIYPVCRDDGTFLGVVHGGDLFQAQAVELTAQAGAMVGVDAEERSNTPMRRSLKFRHPWLQFNILTCFVSAACVAVFEEVINTYVILAIFLPVMIGQATNIGCQALAVTLRGLTLGDASAMRPVLVKEFRLALFNGFFSGVTAGAGFAIYAAVKQDPHALQLGGIMVVSMTLAGLVAGVAGAAVPLALKALKQDPATASSIFLTTIAEVAAIVAFLGFAMLWLA